MMNSNRSGRGKNEKRFERRDFEKPARSQGKPGMHRATCSECGNSCEVPFKPTNSRPVFCMNCFKKDGSAKPRRSEEKSYDNRSFGRDSGRDSGRDFGRDSNKPPMHRATCAECGDSCEVPFRPTGGKPVFCSNCFRKEDKKPSHGQSHSNTHSESKKPDQFKEQLEKLNYKLDKILKFLDPTPKESVVVAPEQKVKTPKPKKEAKKESKKEVKKVVKKAAKKRK